MKKAVATVCSALLIAGCASRGFDRGALQKPLYKGEEQIQITDSAIELALGTKPQIRLPFRLGIHLDTTSQWTPADKEQLLALGKQLKKDGIVTDFFLLPESILPGKDWDSGFYSPSNLRRIRLGAARLQADAVLDIRASSVDDTYTNFLVLTYPTLIGMWFAPGNHRDTLFVMTGTLWDVRNEYLYAVVEAEGIGRSVRPLFYSRSEVTLTPARTEAIGFFAKEFAQRMRNLKG